MTYDSRLTPYEFFIRPAFLLAVIALIYSWINLANQYFALTFELVIPFIVIIGVFVSPVTAGICALFIGLAFDSTATMLHFYCTGYYLFTAGVSMVLSKWQAARNPFVGGFVILILVLGKLLLLEMLYIPIFMQYPQFKHIWFLFNWTGFILIVILSVVFWVPIGRGLNKYEGDRFA